MAQTLIAKKKDVVRKNSINSSISFYPENFSLLESMRKKENSTRSKFINDAIKAYAKIKLEEDLKNAYLEDNLESKDFVNDGIYLFNEVVGK